MDINNFQAKLTRFANAGLFRDKGAEAERIKKENNLRAQTGPEADTVEIDFGRLAGLSQQSGSGQSGVGKLVNDISQMSMEQAQAALQNPDIFAKLVKGGILE